MVYSTLYIGVYSLYWAKCPSPFCKKYPIVPTASDHKRSSIAYRPTVRLKTKFSNTFGLKRNKKNDHASHFMHNNQTYKNTLNSIKINFLSVCMYVPNF